MRKEAGRAPRRELERSASVVIALLVAVLACDDVAARAALDHGQETEEALVEAVLEALVREDREALQGLLVSREEYEGLLWPSLPDKEFTQFEFVWGLNEANSRKGLGQLLSRYGGLQLELVSITLSPESEVYDSFTLYQGVEVKVRRSDTGEEGILSSFDVLVDHGGSWKLLNYDEL